MFIKLPTDAKKLLDEIVQSANPSEVLCEKLENATDREDEELRGIIRDLHQAGYINVQWADDLPYNVIVYNSARTYNEMLDEYEKQFIIYNNQSINIGDNNVIKNSQISNKAEKGSNNSFDKKSFASRHPVLLSIIISSATAFVIGFILLFSFWKEIVKWIEGLFYG